MENIITLVQVQDILPECGERFPASQIFGKFSDDFKIKGRHFIYGIWEEGRWVFAFNNLRELGKQVKKSQPWTSRPRYDYFIG